MDLISLFTLDTHQGPYAKWPLQTRLFANGVDTGKQVPGYVVEAQYSCAEGFLLITSYDCLFEEANTFLLLNNAYETIASRSLGVMYDTFLLEHHKPLSKDTLELDYGDGLKYTLTIKPKMLGGMKLGLVRVSDVQMNPKRSSFQTRNEA